MLIGKLTGFEKFTEPGIYVVKNLSLRCYSDNNNFDIPQNNKFIVLVAGTARLKIYFEGKIGFVRGFAYEEDAEMDLVRIK